MATRLISLLPCITLAVVFEATNTFDHVAQIINVVQSLCLPFGLIPVVQMTSDESIMVGELSAGRLHLACSAVHAVGVTCISV